MPNALVKKYADLTGKDVEVVEDLWDKAKSIAKAEGRHPKDDAFYPYVVGILKRMLSINEDYMSFKEFNEVMALSESIKEDE